MNTQIRTMAAVNETATKALIQEIGIVDTIRFIHQFSVGQGNYTEDRRPMVESMTLEDILAGIDEMKRLENYRMC